MHRRHKKSLLGFPLEGISKLSHKEVQEMINRVRNE